MGCKILYKVKILRERGRRGMYTEMYIGEENKSDKKKLLKACSIILWIIMIGIVVFFTFRSI